MKPRTCDSGWSLDLRDCALVELGHHDHLFRDFGRRGWRRRQLPARRRIRVGGLPGSFAADDDGVTSHCMLIGVAEQFKPETVYISCSEVTFNDIILE
jgi:hypothetical protein